jgi:hypothetical protein
MPSLKEMLEARKVKANDAAKTQNVEQVAQTAKPISALQAKLNAKLGATTTGHDGGRNDNRLQNGADKTPTETAIPVVEQPRQIVEEITPPPGLSGLRLAMWKREQEKKREKQIQNSPKQTPSQSQQQITTKDGRPSNGRASEVQPSQSGGQNNNSASSNSGAETSASQTADAQKTNDGAIDVEELRRNLDYLANNIEQKELVGQVVRTIATQLHKNTSLQKFMRDSDVDLVVRAVRSSYQIAARKKTEKAESKKTNTAQMTQLQDAMKELGLDLKL